MPLPNLTPKSLLFTSLWGLSLISAPQAASAFSLTSSIGTLNFTETSGNFTITGGETSGKTFRLFQDVTGPDLDLFISIDGLPSLTQYIVNSVDSDGQPVSEELSGFWFESVLTNRTDSAWTFFDHEVQSSYQQASPNDDGLSFGQGLVGVVPVSDIFPTISQVQDVRDFINFTGGTVDIGKTVTFRYFISDWSSESTFWLRQRPNYSVAQGGFVEPPAQATSASETPAMPAPTDPESVPEPGVVLGLLGMGTIACKRRAHLAR